MVDNSVSSYLLFFSKFIYYAAPVARMSFNLFFITFVVLQQEKQKNMTLRSWNKENKSKASDLY